ncbi:putative MATE efflux family protein subfamily [Dactylonectria macrodidyma]|uniref:MATE efflux family protein subfamily n=1 Tax=Dactylonectria macrodidyma TaxID=307937 RepID=A0A9P9D896_9HYPO|nr:putative MATE efflux family protein subfamily [Dactylonectria macrodidyma]
MNSGQTTGSPDGRNNGPEPPRCQRSTASQARSDDDALFPTDDLSSTAKCDCQHGVSRPSSPASTASRTAYTPPLDRRDEKKDQSLATRIYRFFFRTGPATRNADDTAHEPTETSPLLGSGDGRPHISGDAIEAQRGEIIDEIDVTWQHEVKTLTGYAAPLVVTFLLQYLIDISSIIAVGRIGKVELGAVSLANMSASISCFAVFQGLATSLDTLCAQAYGSGNKHLVGLYCQRMTLFLLCLTIPIAVLWMNSEYIIMQLVNEAEIASLASSYLHVLILALPGYAVFETGKRFLQAQGLFQATTYVLLIGAPINALLQWLLVWKLELGFIGAPLSVVITRTLLPILLVLYILLFKGSQCWGGFSMRAFSNWWIMIRLALPGMVMIEAEWLAFEILTVISSRFGTEYLAAQSILIAATTISYQIPFPVSIAASTRVARLIGAGRVNDAKVAARVAVAASLTCTFINFMVYLKFKVQIPLIFTDDEAVAALVSMTLPLVGLATFFDGAGVAAHGLLRGIGKQAIGGPANIIAYYLVSLPLAVYFGFALDYKIDGLWMGCTIGLIVVSFIEYAFLLMTDWRKAVLEAVARNAAG